MDVMGFRDLCECVFGVVKDQTQTPQLDVIHLFQSRAAPKPDEREGKWRRQAQMEDGGVIGVEVLVLCSCCKAAFTGRDTR